jgi:hypothetical protein
VAINQAWFIECVNIIFSWSVSVLTEMQLCSESRMSNPLLALLEYTHGVLRIWTLNCSVYSQTVVLLPVLVMLLFGLTSR